MSPQRPLDYWMQVGDELLADGEWHDGLELVDQMRAAITPGVAMRQAERARAATSGTNERVIPVSDNRLVSIGRRSLVIAHIQSRVRFGLWEVDPWPIPPNGYNAGGWQVRDLRPGRMTLPDVQALFHVSPERLRALIRQEPPLDYAMRGRWLYLTRTELPALEERVKQYKEESNRRRGNGPRRRHELARRQRTTMSLTELARQSGIAGKTADKLRLENPQLPWIQRGKRWHSLPLSALPAWNLVVEIHKRGTNPRRVQAMNDGRRRDRRAHSP